MASPFKSAAKRPRSWFMPRKSWTSQHRTRPLIELLEDRVTPSLLYGATPVFPAGGDTSATISHADTTTNIAASTNGDIFVAYGGDSVRVATSTNRGLSFQTSDILSSDATSEVAVTTEGASDVYVAWTALGSETSDAYLSVSTNDGATWSAPQTVTTNGDFNGAVGGINLAVYGSQVYVESSSFGGDVYVNDNNGIGTYTVAGVVQENYLKLQVDPANGVAYTIGDTSGPLFLAESTNSGTSFSAMTLSNPGEVTVVDSTVASSFGQAGNFAFVAGDGNADGTDPTAAAKINLATDAVTPLTVGDSTVTYQRSLAADGFGNLVDSYDESGVLKYEVSQDLGASFAAPVTVADGASSNVAINPAYQDILVVYQVGNNLYLNVYDGELAGASPTITTTASPATATLGTTAPTISDSAVMSGADNATGSLSFVLDLGNTQVYSTSDPLTGDGNGTYGASYTLPTTGTVTGTYTWYVSYAGDALNNSAVDQGGTAEQTVVSAATPTLVTTASPNGTITLGTTTQALSDSADLEGAYFPSGSITFSLSYNGGTPFVVATDLVSHNGTPLYGASYTLLSNSSHVTGTYDWSAVYSGDGNNNTTSDPGTSDQEQVTVSAATPTLVTTASPNGTITLGTTTQTLSDSADLEGAYFPSGSITFSLSYNGGTPFVVATDPVSHNGTPFYGASYTLLSNSSQVTGTYDWSAVYSGDVNNNTATDPGTSDQEHMTVSAASPTLVTTANLNGTVTLGTTTQTLNDSANLEGAYFPSGSITFSLSYNGGAPFVVATDPVSHNGTPLYGASYTLLSNSSQVTGTYDWSAVYSGDVNNNTASDPGTSAQEQVTVSAATPTLVTTANPNGIITLGTTTQTLSDSADLEGAYFPSGSITFSLSYNGGTPFVVATDTVSHNGTPDYGASYTLLSNSSQVTGTYDWSAVYSGDGNNNTASDPGTSAQEQVTVSAASPTLVTTANLNGTVTLGTTTQTLNDSADLEGAYFPSGSITFSLSYNGGTPFVVATDPVSHNGTPFYGASYTLLSNSSQVTGTYDWSAVYSGDVNNNTASDPGTSAQEQVTVSAASPAITVSAGPPVVLGTGVKLTASAILAGGYYETGSITFTLYNPSNTPVDTETVSVSGNNTYTTPSGYLPSIAGTYQWVASYGGDANNKGKSTTNGSAPQAVVSAGVSVVGSTLYLVGGNTNDQLYISPIGASQTGSTGISVTGRLNNVNINQTYTQALTTIYVVGLGGNDTFQFAGSLTIATVISDGDGNDTIRVGNGTNTVTLGNGNDSIHGGGGSIQGGNGNNIIMAGNGNDTVTLGNGNNSITVGTGNDNIQLSNGTNSVTAGAAGSTSNDQIQLGNGNNDSVTLLGNGNNQVTLGNGNDDSVTMNGNGNDTVQVGTGTGDSVSLLGNGNDTVQTGNGTGTVYLPGTGKETLHLGSGWTRI